LFSGKTVLLTERSQWTQISSLSFPCGEVYHPFSASRFFFQYNS
jgi:hypothetical protein